MILSFHPSALEEYEASARFYSSEASESVALAFVSSIERDVSEICLAPTRWHVVEKPGIRRFVCHRFPFVLYYREEGDAVVVYAVMHASRKPGYWKDRLI